MAEPREITTYDREQMYLALASPGGKLILDVLQSEADNLVTRLESWEMSAEEERKLVSFMKAYRHILRVLKSHERQLVEEFRSKYDVEGPATVQEGAAEELAIVE